MSEQDLDRVIGMTVTNKAFGEQLCKLLSSKNAAEVVRILCQNGAEADLTDKEVQWLITNKDKFCECMAECRNQLGIEYDFSQADDGDPKSH